MSLETDDNDNTSPKDRSDTEWASHWTAEFKAAWPAVKKWHKQGDKIYKKFLDEGDNDTTQDITRLNLFYANIITLQAMLYGQLPKVEVDRTFADANDDVARVAAEMLERICNQDIQRPGDNYGDILMASLQDRLLPGLGQARVKYDYTSTLVDVPAIKGEDGTIVAEAYQEEQLTDEWVDTVYTHWKDYIWSPARTRAEVRWEAFRSYMTEPELTKRFPKVKISELPMKSKGPMASTNEYREEKIVEPQAEVWEIWDFSTCKVFWYVEKYQKILDKQDDPLELDQFFCSPPPMVANLTTQKYMPRPDYVIAQDLYSKIDVLQTRIDRLIDACKLVGVYDKANDEVKMLFNDAVENQLIPVANWANFSEQGGLEGAVDWLPLETVSATIEKLEQEQQAKIQQLYEITGMSDILRGAATQPYASATEQKIKAQFASIRVQALQDAFAKWASTLQTLKVEIISKHYDPQTIITQSNIMSTPDGKRPDLVQQAVALIKDPKGIRWRIIVRPESLALADYQQMKQDRTEFMAGLSQFMQSASGLLEMSPQIAPYLLQMLQWGMAGFKGANQIEGVLDQAIDMYNKQLAEQAAQPKKPSPDEIKAQTAMQLGQLKIQQAQEEHQSKMQQIQATQSMELERAQAEHKAKMEQIKAQMALDQQKMENAMEVEKAKLVVAIATVNAQQNAATQATASKMIADTEKTQAKATTDSALMTHGANIEAATAEHQAAVQKDTVEHQANTQKEVATHAAKVSAKSGDSGNGGGNK